MAKKNKEPKAPKVKKVKEPKVKKAKKVKEPKVKKIKKSRMAPNNAAGEKKKYRVIGSPVRVLLVSAVLSLLLGIVLYKVYYTYYAYIDYIVGGLIALVGVVAMLTYFCKRMIDGVYRNEFALGIICLGVGGYIILRSGTDATFFLTIIGLLAALSGVIKLQYSLDLIRMGYKKWWLTLAMSILSLAIGVVILMDLLGGLEWITKVMYTGLALLGNALFDIISLICIALRNRKAGKAAELEAIPEVVEEGPAFEVELVEEEPLPVVIAEEFPASVPGEEAGAAEEEPVAEPLPEAAEEPEAEAEEKTEE